MAEYIDRRVATNAIGSIDTSRPMDDKDDIIEQAIFVIEHIPTVDVVHCCDCKCCVAFQRSADSEVMLTCTYHTFRLVDPTDYCVWGERKDNG